MVVRPFEAGDDGEKVGQLLADLSEVDGFPPLGETKFVDFGEQGLGTGFIAEADGLLIGYAHLLHHGASDAWELEMAVHPEHRDIQTVEGLLKAARPHADGRLLWWVFGSEAISLAEQAGTEMLRELHKLRGALPPTEDVPFPDWAEVRKFRPGIDDDAWLETNNAAFAGHLENGSWTADDLNERVGRDWFDAEGFRLAWADDRLAGFCWTKRHSAEVGEIYVIGVHPEYQARGLGRAIVVEAMHYLAGSGNKTCILYADTSNPSALELYRSLGFGLERVDRCVVVPNG